MKKRYIPFLLIATVNAGAFGMFFTQGKAWPFMLSFGTTVFVLAVASTMKKLKENE